MLFKNFAPTAAARPVIRSTQTGSGVSTAPSPVGVEDKAQIDWSGSKPAHRDVKRLTRGIAAGVGLAGAAKIAYDVATAPTLGSGLVSAAISLAATGVGLTALDVASGIAHHAGDNYRGNPGQLRHTKWHTDPDAADYCMVGFSNKALDAVGFWPKWEAAVYKATGAEPVSWQVPEYKSFCLGETDKMALHNAQLSAGRPA